MTTIATDSRKPRHVIARVVRELMLGGPATATQLSKIIWGSSHHRGGVIAAIETLRMYAVVRIHSWDANGFARYEVQRTPGVQPDMPSPERARSDRQTVAGRAPQRFPFRGELRTAKQIAEIEGVDIQAVRKRLRAKECVA